MPTLSHTTFQMYFPEFNFCIWIQISPKFVSKNPITNMNILDQIMVWHQTGNRPLPERTRYCTIPPPQPKQIEWPMWPWPMTYWPGNGMRHIVPSWVVPDMNIFHEIITNKAMSGHSMRDRWADRIKPIPPHNFVVDDGLVYWCIMHHLALMS